MWRSEWSALSRRILGLLEAAKFHVSYIGIVGLDADTGAGLSLEPVTRTIFEDLRAFRDRYARTLPTGADKALAGFFKESTPTFNGAPDLPGYANRSLHVRLTKLVALEAEVSYHLTDFRARAKRLSERAFAHLQRTIVADPDCASRWKRAFKHKDEMACEKLGAAHLLWHGIWAFKANTAGERTDLIMGDVLHDRRADIEEVAEALVLTEWKKVTEKSKLHSALNEARRQAKLYAGGGLWGVELDAYRYLVLVTEEGLEMPGEFEDAGVLYHPINIAVAPHSPSRAARRRQLTVKHGAP